MASSVSESASANRKLETELRNAEKRRKELDGLFARLYEDRVSGKITEYNFNMLSGKYQSEQAELDEKITAIRNSLSTVRQNESNVEKWLKLIREYNDITELTAPLLNALIEKIVIHQGIKKADGTLEQEVEIYYRFIGKIE